MSKQSTEALVAERIRETTALIEEEQEEKRAARALRLKRQEQAKKYAVIERVAGLLILVATVLIGIAIQYLSPK